MPISSDDQARLPPMIHSEEVNERQRLDDLKAFRKYLADTGAVKCLVKLYQHVAKHELRMDNPQVTKEFLEAYQGENPDAPEIKRLLRENATLCEANAAMEQQVEDMNQEMVKLLKLRDARQLWQALLSSDFWAGVPDGASAEGLSLAQLYRRLCGCKVNGETGKVLVDLLQPAALAEAAPDALVGPKEAFCAWFADGMAESSLAWCNDELLPRLSAAAPGEPPFEKEVLEAIHESGLIPHYLDQVHNMIELDPGLQEFLTAIVARFTGDGGGGGDVPLGQDEGEG